MQISFASYRFFSYMSSNCIDLGSVDRHKRHKRKTLCEKDLMWTKRHAQRFQGLNWVCWCCLQSDDDLTSPSHPWLQWSKKRWIADKVSQHLTSSWQAAGSVGWAARVRRSTPPAQCALVRRLPTTRVRRARRPFVIVSAPFLRHGDSSPTEDRCPRLPGQSRWVWQLGRPFGPTVLPATWSQFPWHTPMISILGCEGHLVSPGWPGLRFGAGLRKNHLHGCHDRFFTNPPGCTLATSSLQRKEGLVAQPNFPSAPKVHAFGQGGWLCVWRVRVQAADTF